MALGLGLAACQQGLSVGFSTAAGLVQELIEARDEKRLLLRLQRQLAAYSMLRSHSLTPHPPAFFESRDSAFSAIPPQRIALQSAVEAVWRCQGKCHPSHHGQPA